MEKTIFNLKYLNIKPILRILIPVLDTIRAHIDYLTDN